MSARALPQRRIAPGPRPLRLLARMLAVHRSRRALAALDADRLRDLNIAPEAAKVEAARAPWDAPGFPG